MMRGLAGLLAGILFVLPLLGGPPPFVGLTGLVGAAFALVAIAMRWRWAFTVASSAFLLEYAMALSLSAAPVDFVAAAAFGLALLLFLSTGDFARRVGPAAVERAVCLAHLRRWLTLGGGTLGATVAALVLTGLVGGALPLAAAPLAAAVGALGVLLALATMVRRSERVDP